MVKLKLAVDEIAQLQQENDRVATHEAMQRLLDMDFEYLPQSEVAAKIFDDNNSIMYLKSCGFKPEQLRLEVGGREFPLQQTTLVFVRCPERNLNVLYHIVVEAVNLHTNVAERLRFQMLYPNNAMAYEFRPTECCQYRVSCYLYDIHISNSPIVVETGVSDLAVQVDFNI